MIIIGDKFMMKTQLPYFDTLVNELVKTQKPIVLTTLYNRYKTAGKSRTILDKMLINAHMNDKQYNFDLDTISLLEHQKYQNVKWETINTINAKITSMLANTVFHFFITLIIIVK